MRICDWLKELWCRKSKPVTSMKEESMPADYTISEAFEHTWSVVDFSKKYGKMQIGKFPSVNNRESFWVCQFKDATGKCTPVTISSKLQGITPKEIAAEKDKIKVGQQLNGKYVLFDFRSKKWEDVDLGL